MSVGGSARKQPTLNAFLSQSDSGCKGSNSKLTSGKGTSGEVCPALSDGNAKVYTNKELTIPSLLPEVWSGAKLLHQMASAPLDGGLKLLACTRHAGSIGLGPSLAASAILTMSQVLLPATRVHTSEYAAGPMPGASVFCIHIVVYLLGAASAKGKKKVGEVIDLLDDDPGMASQDLQGSPMPVSPLRVMLAGLLHVVNVCSLAAPVCPSWQYAL